VSDSTAPLLLYDGYCGLCNAWVRWLLAVDRRAVFRFAALQSAVGRSRLGEYDLDPGTQDTVIVIADGEAYARSDALVAVFARLTGFWRTLRFIRYCPRRLRDVVYELVARHRYRLFGRYATRPLPPDDHRERFLDAGENAFSAADDGAVGPEFRPFGDRGDGGPRAH
jgi:predicted DCC family thiol-disulfide oxidoreductase YuxK